MPVVNKTDLVQAFGMAPVDAVDFFQKKGYKITWDWTETLGDANNSVFQVAKSMRMDVLQTIRKEVDAAISKGVTFDVFRKNLEPLLVQKGWWGKKTVIGPRGAQVVQLGSPHRLATIYRTNVQSAYNAGRWKGQVENKANRPYLMLIEVLDQSTRKTHHARSGSIAPVDSPFWTGPNSWYPPNGFNCRGRVRSLTDDEAKKRGIGVKGDGPPDPGFGGNPGNFYTPEPDQNNYNKDILEKANQETAKFGPTAPWAEFDNAADCEKWASGKGVFADYDGNVVVGNVTNQAISIIQKSGGMYPSKVVTDSNYFKKMRNPETCPGYFDPRLRDTIFMNPNANKFKGDAAARLASAQKAFTQKWWSTPLEAHAGLHEMAHFAHFNFNGRKFWPDGMTEAELKKKFRGKWPKIKIVVSEYAGHAHDPAEFVAEMYCGKLNGIKYSAEMEDLYTLANGPKI